MDVESAEERDKRQRHHDKALPINDDDGGIFF